MNSPTRVAVVFGGVSSEAEVSEWSGARVSQSLPRDRFRVLALRIDRSGAWHLGRRFLEEGEGPNSDGVFDVRPDEAPSRLASMARAFERLGSLGIDVAFIALHGRGGEDGAIQGLFETAGIPFTGSGVAACALAMDKWRARDVFAASGISVPHAILVRADRLERSTVEAIHDAIRWPCVVKPRAEGSSVGVSIVAESDSLASALEEVREVAREAIIEEFVAGRELTCGVIGNSGSGELEALPPTEIRPVGSPFFDYRAKYTSGAAEEITPAPVDSAVSMRLQEIALRAHEALGCDGFSRTDAILRDDDLYVLETNTIPGLTDNSLLPRQAAAAGIAFPELLDRIVRLALACSRR